MYYSKSFNRGGDVSDIDVNNITTNKNISDIDANNITTNKINSDIDANNTTNKNDTMKMKNENISDTVNDTVKFILVNNKNEKKKLPLYFALNPVRNTTISQPTPPPNKQKQPPSIQNKQKQPPSIQNKQKKTTQPPSIQNKQKKTTQPPIQNKQKENDDDGYDDDYDYDDNMTINKEIKIDNKQEDNEIAYSTYNKKQHINEITQTLNSKDFFLTLHGVDMGYNSIFDYIRNQYNYSTNELDLYFFNTMGESYRMSLISTYGQGSAPYIKNGTTYSILIDNIWHYYNDSNYFHYKTDVNRLHLIIGSKLMFEKINIIDGVAHVLLLDKYNQSNQANLLFYPDNTPLTHPDGPEWGKELSNKILIHYSEVATRIHTSSHFEMVVAKKFYCYVNIFNLNKKIKLF